jgi:DNA-binding beta-propeller fold protein YncE
MRGVRLAILSALVAFVVGGASARAETVYVTANTFSPFGGEPAFISQYAQADDGSLTQLSPWQVGTPLGSQGRGSNVAEMVLSADGMSLYAADNFNGRVVQYDVASDGQLTLKSPPFVSLGTPLQGGAEGLALSPDGQSLYVASGDGQVFQFDVDADGLLHPKVPASVSFGTIEGDVAVSPDGRWAWVTDAGNEDGTTIGQFEIGVGGRLFPNSPPTVTTAPGPQLLTVGPDGASVYVDNYGLNGAGTTVSQYDVTPDGTLQPKSPPTVDAQGPGEVAITPDGTSAYVPLGGTNQSGNTVAQFDVGGGGLLSPKSPATVPSGQDPIPAAVDAAGASTYVGNVVDLTVSQYDVGTGGALSPKATPTVNNNGVPSAIALAPADGPQASFSASVSGTTASVDASASGPDVARYDWDFGDGTMLSDGGPTPTHAYSGHGPFIATLTVTDATGCGPSGVWIGHQFLCTGGQARTHQVVDIPAPPGPPSPTGATGAAGATGPQGEPRTTGAPPAGRLDVALLFDRLRAKRGRTVTMPFASSAFAGIVLSVYHGGHRVARFQQFAHEGRNTVRWRSGRAAAGRYKVVLEAVGLDDQRSLDRASLSLRRPRSATTSR